MTAFIIAMVFGIAQMLLLSRLLRCATSGRTFWMLLLLLIKGGIYLGSVALLILRYQGHLIPCICGFSAGLPLGAVLYFILITVWRRIPRRNGVKKA